MNFLKLVDSNLHKKGLKKPPLASNADWEIIGITFLLSKT
jgi:hypothetical protein